MGALTIRFSTVPGTGVADVHYRPHFGAVAFVDGQTEVIVSVPLANPSPSDLSPLGLGPGGGPSPTGTFRLVLREATAARGQRFGRGRPPQPVFVRPEAVVTVNLVVVASATPKRTKVRVSFFLSLLRPQRCCYGRESLCVVLVWS